MKNKFTLSIALAAFLFALNTHSMQLPAGATEISRASQVDGKTLVLGSQKFAGQDVITVFRYLPNNELDMTFGTDGMITATVGESAEPKSIEVQPADGKILVKAIVDGQETQILFNQDGSMDFTFGEGGIMNPQIVKLL